MPYNVRHHPATRQSELCLPAGINDDYYNFVDDDYATEGEADVEECPAVTEALRERINSMLTIRLGDLCAELADVAEAMTTVRHLRDMDPQVVALLAELGFPDVARHFAREMEVRCPHQPLDP